MASTSENVQLQVEDESDRDEDNLSSGSKQEDVSQKLSKLEKIVEGQSESLQNFIRTQAALNEKMLAAFAMQSGRGHQDDTPTSKSYNPGDIVQLRVAESAVVSDDLEQSSGVTLTRPLQGQHAENNYTLSGSLHKLAEVLSKRSQPIIHVDKPTFSGDNTMLPPIFLKQLEKYFHVVQANTRERLDVAKTCLSGGALSWSLVYETKWDTFEDFQSDFVNHFWNCDKQHLAQTKLGQSRYIAGTGETMSQYFLRQVANYRLFDPPIPELVVVNEIMRQFPHRVQYVWAAVPKTSISSAFDFLDRQDEVVLLNEGSSINRNYKQSSRLPEKNSPDARVNFDPSVPPPKVKIVEISSRTNMQPTYPSKNWPSKALGNSWAGRQ